MFTHTHLHTTHTHTHTHTHSQGSQGKVLDTFTGHEAGVRTVRIDHQTHVCYTLDLLSQLYCWNLEQHVLLHQQSLAPKNSREKDSQAQQHKIWRKVEVHPAKTSFDLVCLFGKTFLLAHTDSHQVHRVILHMSPCHCVSQVECLAEVASGTQGHFTYESCVPDATF